MAGSTTESTSETRNTALEYSHGRRVSDMKGIGLMVNSMELEYLSKKTVVDVEVFGKTVKELKINHKIIKLNINVLTSRKLP